MKKVDVPAKEGEKDVDGAPNDEKLYGSKLEENPEEDGIGKSKDSPYMGRGIGNGSVLRNNMVEKVEVFEKR